MHDETAVETAWEEFLSNKFAATEAEAQRPEMEKLPNTQGSDPLSEEEVFQVFRI